MKQYIVTWTITLESDSADGAVESALDVLAQGDIAPEVEELEEEEQVAL